MNSLRTKNAPVMEHYIDAFRRLQRHSWPDLEVEAALAPSVLISKTPEKQVAHFAEQLEVLRAAYPSLRVFWKDAALDYLGSCTAFAADAGVGTVEALIGLNDTNADVLWSRQGAKYRRDDRHVMAGRKMLLDVVERQDVDSGVRWLRTSKAPVIRNSEVIGIIGAFDVISLADAKRLSASKS
ncbi:MAG: hypothetical protein AB8I08_18315 [Sandaracinaceae bacterium]